MTGPDLRRLDRLEAYLVDDPENPALLADAFAEALGAGAPGRAEFHLRHAQALGLDPSSWKRREAHWLLAQHRWDEARQRLLELADNLDAESAGAAVLAHDLAYVELRAGAPNAGIERLAPFVAEHAAISEADIAIGVLWLQLLHRADRLDDAMAWLRRRESAGTLEPGVAAVGSLIALDAGDHAAALRWAERGLAEQPPRVEALVARASLALAERDPGRARQWLQAALASNDADGRVWSAIGFAELLDRRLPAARDAFERATVLLARHVGTWHGLGWTALAQHDDAAASRAFEQALALDRNFAESHGACAVAHALAGRADAARSAIDRALRLDRGCLSARYADALLRGDAHDSRALMRLAERLFEGRSGPLGRPMIDVVRGGPGTS
jgi:tetratricopeptide (TPR) repeat protein